MSLSNKNRPSLRKKCTKFNSQGTPDIKMIFGGDKRASNILDAYLFLISHGFNVFGEKLTYDAIQEALYKATPAAGSTTLSLKKLNNTHKKVNLSFGGGSSVLSYGQYSRYFRKLYKIDPKKAKKELKHLMKLLN